jgi:putative component of toxin-antitoxin plasmid stabilization module
VEAVGEGGSELKLNWVLDAASISDWRDEPIVILLCGGTKKRQSHDIETAEAR